MHLGRDDGELAAARAQLGGKLLGASCYDSLAARARGGRRGRRLRRLRQRVPLADQARGGARAASLFARSAPLGVPLVAIGGITLENAPQLLAAGADCLAVISDLFDAPDIAGARARLR